MHHPPIFSVVGAAMAVHTELGPGLLEVSYQDAFEIECNDRGIPCEREVAVPVSYKGRRIGGLYRADFRCWTDLVVELKALEAMGRREVLQLSHHVAASGAPHGVLINFGTERVQFQRVLPHGAMRSEQNASGRQS